MSTFTGTAEDGSSVIYVDKKRHLWWLSFISPAISLAAIWLYFAFDKNPIFTLIPALYIFAFTPLVDYFMGCLLYTSPSPRDLSTSRMPSSA